MIILINEYTIQPLSILGGLLAIPIAWYGLNIIEKIHKNSKK